MRWEGRAGLFDAVRSRGQDVEVIVEGRALLVTRDGSVLRLERADLKQADRTAHGEARLVLNHPPGWVLTLPAGAMPALAAAKLMKPRTLGSLDNLRGLLLAGAALLALVLAFFLFAVGPLSGAVATLIPLETERKLGQTVFEQYSSRSSKSKDAVANGALQKAVAAVLPEELTRLPIEVALIEDSTTVNAFALPGGYVVVYRGILNRMEGENELLGVLAHELGHVARRHGVKRIARTAALSILTSLLFGDTGALGSILIRNGAQLTSLDYDRREEREADDFAVERMSARGLDPRGLARLFERLEKDQRGPSLPAFLSTHPPTAERIARLERAPATQAPSSERVLSDTEAAALFRQ